MIARMWTCTVAAENSDAAVAHIIKTGVTDSAAIAGYRGAQLMRAGQADNRIRVTLVTFWESWDSIRAFAGEDVGRAVLYEEDAAYGMQSEDHVTHLEVVHADWPDLPPRAEKENADV